MIEVGYHGKGEILTREQFEGKKAAIAEAKKNRNSNQPKQLASTAMTENSTEFLAQLAAREELVRNGRMSTIIFIRAKPPGKNEISGYIDLAHRMKEEDFRIYF